MPPEYSSAYHCTCSITLACGRSIPLKGLSQHMTYGGLLEGLPSTRYNESLLDDLANGRRDGIFRNAPPIVIPPRRRNYLREPGDMDGLPSFAGNPEWLPVITCMGYFESFPPARNQTKHASALTLIWMQDDYAMPIAAEALEAIHRVDWNAFARDFEY